MVDDNQAQHSGDTHWSRRQFLLAAGAVALTGCGSRVTQSAAVHVVEPHETLSAIAQDYGISVVDLIQINRLQSRELRPGQRLQLPPGARRLPAESAVVAVAQPRPVAGAMVRRAQWGAPEPGTNWDLMGPVHYITLHHTDEYAGMRGLADDVVVNNICRFHRRQNWADIGYHYLVGRDGRVYEGRRVDRQGAHSGGSNNRNNLGISLIGNFDRQLPNDLQLAATRRLLSEQLSHYRLSMSALRGHREWAPTVCPGDALFAWLRQFREGRI